MKENLIKDVVWYDRVFDIIKEHYKKFKKKEDYNKLYVLDKDANIINKIISLIKTGSSDVFVHKGDYSDYMYNDPLETWLLTCNSDNEVSIYFKYYSHIHGIRTSKVFSGTLDELEEYKKDIKEPLLKFVNDDNVERLQSAENIMTNW